MHRLVGEYENISLVVEIPGWKELCKVILGLYTMGDKACECICLMLGHSKDDPVLVSTGSSMLGLV